MVCTPYDVLIFQVCAQVIIFNKTNNSKNIEKNTYLSNKIYLKYFC
jgi:hypothetical protein